MKFGFALNSLITFSSPAVSAAATDPLTLVSSVPIAIYTIPDLGIAQATTPGRVSSHADQSGNGRNESTPTTAAEPSYTAVDSTLNNKASLRMDGVGRYMTNAYNPAAPGTTGYYRFSVIKLNTWASGRNITAAATNRFGVRCGTVSSTVELLNPTLGTAVDMPERQWCIVEQYMSNSTADFLSVGPVTVTGINVGVTDPASLARGASISGGSPCDVSFGADLVSAGLPTAPERAALRAWAASYYGNAVNRTRKILRIVAFGDSITRGANATGDDGWRKTIFDSALAAGYPIDFLGTASNGTFPDSQHEGISGTDVAGIAARVAIRIGPGQTFAGQPKMVLLNIGTNNVSSYSSPGTRTAYQDLLTQIQTAEPGVRIVVSTIPPQLGNPAAVASINADWLTAWNTYDATYPLYPLIRWDAHAALGGAYTPALMNDSVHPNTAGHELMGAAMWSAISSAVNTLTTI